MERNLYWYITDENEGYGTYVVALSRSEAIKITNEDYDCYLRPGQAIENRNDLKEVYKTLDYFDSYELSTDLQHELGMIVWRGYCEKCGFMRDLDYETNLCEECM